ncbi:anti-sigma factor [Streptomyces sp. NPDC054842]
MTTADLHTLTGAYALHALSDKEAAAFERHLASCEACAVEVRELSETAALLGVAASVTPGPELKEHVMRRISTVRQEGPQNASTPSSRSGWRPHRASRWALAACLAAAAALGGTTIWQHERAQDAIERARRTEQRTESVAAVLVAPDAKTRTTQFADGATGTVIVSEALDRAAFVTSGLADPPPGKVYELWFNDGGGAMRPAGFVNTARAATAVLMRGEVGDASGMGLTLEPAGGSLKPTSSPIVLMPFPA